MESRQPVVKCVSIHLHELNHCTIQQPGRYHLCQCNTPRSRIARRVWQLDLPPCSCEVDLLLPGLSKKKENKWQKEQMRVNIENTEVEAISVWWTNNSKFPFVFLSKSFFGFTKLLFCFSLRCLLCSELLACFSIWRLSSHSHVDDVCQLLDHFFFSNCTLFLIFIPFLHIL